jgi:endonuclease/exonuclease/phosphatase family metal-dependent hydrolase
MHYMRHIKRIAVWILASLGIIAGLLVLLVWAITYHPSEVQEQAVVCAEAAPVLQPGQSLKVLTYNVQYMAGKNYVFFYDLPNNAGPDERPAAADITQTIQEVARIIRDENPDIVLLQEVDDGSARTNYEDQLARLLALLPRDYKCHAYAFYWKADFVPHPRIMGAVGQKLSIISKYKIDQADRYQLPLAPADPLTRQFSPKQAILEARLPVTNGQDLILLTTHLEVARMGTEVMQKQVAAVRARLDSLNQDGYAWLIGGDFNLLPPGQFERLQQDQQRNFRPETELKPLFEHYNVIPDSADITGDNGAQWFTMFVNDPSTSEPDRTLDYIFFADSITLTNGYVRQHDTLNISDHLPLIAEFRLP